MESGKAEEPPLAHYGKFALCKKQKATLVIAKLDRLARNLHFISGLMEARIEFLQGQPHREPSDRVPSRL